MIRMRIEGLKAKQLADLLVRVLKQCREDLAGWRRAQLCGPEKD